MSQISNLLLTNPDSDAITKYLRALAQRTSSPPMAVGISWGGSDYRWTSAPDVSASGSIRYQVGCIAKVLNFALILELSVAGKIDIDLPVSSVLPEFRKTSVGDQVLIRHLLCGTAGYLGYPLLASVDWKMTWASFVRQLQGAPIIFRPGDVYSQDYSSSVLLAEIIQRVCGRPWMEVVDETVGIPLFGRRLYVSEYATSIWLGAVFNITLSVEELALLGHALVHGAPKAGVRRVFSDSTVVKLNEILVRVPELSGQTSWFPRGYGFGLAEYRAGLRGLCGRGAKQQVSIRMLPDHDLTLMLCVESINPMVKNTLIDGLLSEMGVEREPDISAALLPAGLSVEDLPGTYIGLRGFGVTVEIQRSTVRIVMRSEGRPDLHVFGTMNDSRSFSLAKQSPALGVAFFSDPTTGCPALMIGTSALRKDVVLPGRAHAAS